MTDPRRKGAHGILDASSIEQPSEPPTATEPIAAPAFSAEQLVAGRYRVVRFLNRGGMGEVYEAEDLELKERVALKTLLPAIASDRHMIERFKKEIQLARKVSHPNVCRVFDLARHPADGSAPDSVVFLTMELLPGQALSAWMHAEGRIAPEQALPLVEQMAEGLEAAHRAGVIHRDFKPSNVMLVPSGDGSRAVITDFGLARNAAPATDTTATLSGTLMGTLDYMAPELLSGAEATPASDVYALGTVAYKMVTGRLPFVASGPLAGAILRTKESPPSPRTVAPDLDIRWEQGLMAALDPDPERRLAHPGELVQAIRGETAPRKTAAPKRTRRMAAVLAALVLLAGGGLGWRAWLRSRNQPSAEGLRWYETGVSALRDATYYRAARALERAVGIDPGFALAHARLAEAWNGLDDGDRAKEEMLNALAGQASHPPARKADSLYVDAIHRTLMGDFSGASAAYTDLTKRVPDAERPQVLVDLGFARERNNEIPKALEAYQSAARLDRQNAAAHLRAAMVLGVRMSKTEDAAREFAAAESLYAALSNTEGQAEVLFQRGWQASRAHNLPQARSDLEKAIQLARAIGSEHQEIAAALQLSIVTYLEGDAPRAEAMAAEAVTRAQRLGQANLAARGLTDLGIARQGGGDYGGAESSLREAVELARRFRLHRNEARASLQLASVHVQQGDAQNAVKEAAPALAFYRQAGFPLETSQALTVLARAHRILGLNAEARADFEQLAARAEASGDKRQMMSAEQGLGTLLFQTARWPEALRHLDRNYQLALELGDRAAMGIGLMNRGRALWSLGRYAEAERALREAEPLMQQPGSDVRLPGLIALNRAEMGLSQGRFAAAASRAQEAWRMASTTKQAQARARCIGGLATAKAGSRDEGERLCQEGLAISTGLGDKVGLMENRLTMAEILVASRPEAALEQSRPARQAFEELGQKELEWRAWAVEALALRRAGNAAGAREAAGQATRRLNELKDWWGAEAWEGYRLRGDIRAWLKELAR